MRNSILLASMLLISVSACQKQTTNPQPDATIAVDYHVVFSKPTDFMFEYSDVNGSNRDTIYGVSSYHKASTIKDQADRFNVWVGACIVKAADVNNCKMKVYAMIGSDTLKQCSLGTCCTIH